MTGQDLSSLGVDAAIGEIGDEGVTEGVKVNDLVRPVTVRDACGLQVDAEHLGQAQPRRQLEDTLDGVHLHHVLAELGRRGPEQRQSVVAAVFGVGGEDGDRGHLGFEIERRWRQAAKFTHAETGFNCKPIEHRPVAAGHPPGDDAVTVAAE
ncbi:MAG: hypothetical protein AABZ53_13065 [Planctomycetota bacterium]